MTEPNSDPLADTAFFAAFLDTLIPPATPMPGAGQVLTDSLRAQITDNPAFTGPVNSALAALRDAALENNPGGFVALSADARENVLRELMAAQPVLGMLMLFVFASYYQQPSVRAALGLPTEPPFPKGHEIQATEASLLSKLRARADHKS